MATSSGRLSLAPDDHSGPRRKQKSRTASLPRLVTGIDARPVPQAVPYDSYGRPPHFNDKGDDMAKRTRPPGLTDSGTRNSGVNITPPSSEGPVTTTSSLR